MRNSFFATRALALAALSCCLTVLQACEGRSATKADDKTASSPSLTPPVGQDSSQQNRTLAGPRIAIDSSASGPRLEVRDDTYVLALPPALARTLFDSLPDFSPFQLSDWEPKTVAAFLSSAQPNRELPSVVLGDFNRDTKLDVALHGWSGNTVATLMLVSSSDGAKRPRLLVLNRGKRAKGFATTYIGLVQPHQVTDPVTLELAVDLKTDAVQYVVHNSASILYYLDHGAIRKYSSSD